MEKKYNVKNFRASRVLLLFLLLPSLLYGQDVITFIPTLYSINSVIREIEPGVTLTYDEPPTFTSQKHRFIYNDENGVTLVAEIPNDYYVNDMEIDNGCVYFCGRKEGTNTQGMFGSFNISNVFFNNGNINCCVIPSPILSYYWSTGYDYIQNLSRIELMKLNDGIHLFMVADGMFQNYASNTWRVWGLIDAHCGTSGIWKMHYTLDYDRRIVYDDVAVTDDYVVATVHTYRRDSWFHFTHGYLYYPLPVNADTNIFEPYAIPIAPVMSMIPGYYTDLEDCDYDTSARVLIEHSGKSFFNTVLSSFSTGCGAFSLLSSYQDVGVPIHKGLFRQHAPRPFTEIKGRIDANSGMLYMVEPYFPTRIIRVNLSPNLPIPAGSDVQLVSNSYHWQSLDVARSTPQQAVVSGAIQDHEKMFWRHDSFLSSVCRTVQDIPLLTVEKKDIPFEIPQYRMMNDDYSLDVIHPVIHEYAKVTICQ